MLRIYQDLLHHYGISFRDVRTCAEPPARVAPEDFLLWVGESDRLPALPPGATGLIRSRKTGLFGLVYGRSEDDFDLLRSRWDEVEAAGEQLYFDGSVSENERGTDDLRWVLDRLVESHSHSYSRSVDWDTLERGARRRIAAADNARDHFRAWEWLFARLHDGHTKLLSVNRPNACSRVHCGVYGCFADRHRFLVEQVHAGSAAAAGLKPGIEILRVNGRDWPSYLRQESAYWAFSSAHLRRACRRFMPWHQAAGTRLELETPEGNRRLDFGDESYPGFFHWTCGEEPEPVAFNQVGPARYRLRIAYFAGPDGFIPACKRALSSVPEGAELELDLRGNGGGNGVSAYALSGMLLPQGTPLARRRGRRVDGGFTPWTVYRNPDRPVYLGPLTVMMDELCASATEQVIGALKAAGRATLVGRRSAGSTGSPRTLLSAGAIRFTCSSWEETSPAGEPIEGHGITTRRWPRERVR